MIFIRASISIKGYTQYYHANQNTKSEKDETRSLFFQLKQQTLWLVFLLIFVIITTLKQTFIIVFLYLANLLLGYSTVPCGFDIRPYGQRGALFVKSYHCASSYLIFALMHSWVLSKLGVVLNVESIPWMCFYSCSPIQLCSFKH